MAQEALSLQVTDARLGVSHAVSGDTSMVGIAQLSQLRSAGAGTSSASGRTGAQHDMPHHMPRTYHDSYSTGYARAPADTPDVSAASAAYYGATAQSSRNADGGIRWPGDADMVAPGWSAAASTAQRRAAFASGALQQPVWPQDAYAGLAAAQDTLPLTPLPSIMALTVAARLNKVMLSLHTCAPESQTDTSDVANTLQLVGLETSSLYCQVNVMQQHAVTVPVTRSHGSTQEDKEETGKGGGMSTSISISEAVTGEVSGMVLNVDVVSLEHLSQMGAVFAKQATKHAARRPSRHTANEHSRRQQQEAGAEKVDEGGDFGMLALPFPILLHVQNIQMSLSAPFSWEALEDTAEQAQGDETLEVQARQTSAAPPSQGASIPSNTTMRLFPSPEANHKVVHAAYPNVSASEHDIKHSNEDGSTARGSASMRQTAQDKTFSGKMTLVMVRGKIEGGCGAGSLVSIDLDADNGSTVVLARPVLMLTYQEWEHVTTTEAPAQRMRQPVASSIIDEPPARISTNGLSIPSAQQRHVRVDKVVHHTVFSMQRLLLQGTPAYFVEEKTKTNGREKAAQDAPPCAPAAHDTPELFMPLSPSLRRRGYHVNVDLDRDTDRERSDWGASSFAETWSSEDDESVSPNRRLQRRPPHAPRRTPAKWQAARARVIMSGVRLDWQASMQHSMLEVCLAHHAALMKLQHSTLAAQQHTPRPRADDALSSAPTLDDSRSGANVRDLLRQASEPDANDYSFGAAPAASRAEGASVSLEVHDTWLNLLFTKRAVLAIDIPHAIMSVSPEALAHFPVQTRSKPQEHRGSVCGVEVQDFAVHRMRDHACHASILAGTIGKTTFEGDCQTFPQRPSPHVPSDRFVHVKTFRASTPLAALLHMCAAPEVQAAAKRDATTHAQLAHVEVVGVGVEVPMPANISLHGRREGLRGAWSSQHGFVKDSIGYWTDLGVVARDAILVLKALQVLAKERISLAKSMRPDYNAAEQSTATSMTELPSGMPDVDLQMNKLEVKVMDDSFEIWMGAFQRLHLDESLERLKRENLLTEKLDQLRRTGFFDISAEDESRMRHKLALENVEAWLKRVDKFKRSDFFLSPPPLMSFQMDQLCGLFMPRQASWLQHKLALLVCPFSLPVYSGRCHDRCTKDVWAAQCCEVW